MSDVSISITRLKIARKHALVFGLVDSMLERWRRVLNTGAVLLVALFSTCRLSAQELGPTLLSYRAPDGCPGVADFQRSVQSRSARVRFVELGAHDRELSIAIHQDGDFTKGELRLIERDGSLRQRNVRFTTCSEAVEGLALIAVVSLDPQALLQPDTPPEPGAVPEPAPPAPPSPKAPPPPKRDAVPMAQQSKTRWALGGEFNVAFRALPATALGGSLFLDVASRSESRFAPLFRAALSHVQRRGLSSGGAEAEANFTLTLATLMACPVRVAGGFLVLRPCAFASGGALHAWGSKTSNVQQRTRPYGALGGSALLFGRVSQTIEIVADFAIGATVLQDSFGFDQDQSWTTPALYLSSGIGVRFVFP